MSTTRVLLTVEEFERIPNPSSGIYELHHGELVLVPPPQFEHGFIERNAVPLLERSCGPTYYVSNELAFRPLPEYEVWTVDVGMVLRDRVRGLRKGWLRGSPDLAIEILSPSNTARGMIDRERTFFQGGCRQFWIVDPDTKTVKTSTPDGRWHLYRSGDLIPMDMFGGQPIRVDDLFIEP